MKLDRNIEGNDGRNKYAILKLRELAKLERPGGGFPDDIYQAITTLLHAGILDWGDTPDTEFFVMRLRDEYARPALRGYAWAAKQDGQDEYANEVAELARRSGLNHPSCKKPD